MGLGPSYSHFLCLVRFSPSWLKEGELFVVFLSMDEHMEPPLITLEVEGFKKMKKIVKSKSVRELGMLGFASKRIRISSLATFYIYCVMDIMEQN